ncbi:MAG: hypothetical protein KQH53_03355 [Desulfarculaceae bacterium]|nr:hypothetical protein [Desulfarculaceae bacterium]
MPIDRRWTKAHTVVSIALLSSLLLLSMIGKWGPWFAQETPAPHRPATAGNLVLSIDSNLIRAQVIMENLVFAEDLSELAPQVKTVDLLTEEITRDFQAMAEFFTGDNPQFNRAQDLFREWKAIRDQVIKLSAAGPTIRAQKMVLGQSAAHVQKIRDALVKLERFTKKRGEEFDSKAYHTYQEEQKSR